MDWGPHRTREKTGTGQVSADISHSLLLVSAVPDTTTSLPRYCTLILRAKINPSSCVLLGGHSNHKVTNTDPGRLPLPFASWWIWWGTLHSCGWFALGREMGVSHQVHHSLRSFSAPYMGDNITFPQPPSRLPFIFVSLRKSVLWVQFWI